MFKIDVTFNGETFTQDVDTYLSNDIAEAMSDAVNDAAAASQLRLMEYMGEAFDRPRQITVQRRRAEGHDGIPRTVRLSSPLAGSQKPQCEQATVVPLW